MCGHLPLALRGVSARAVARPGLPLSALAAEMGDAWNQLDVLETGEPATSVRVVFSWSRAKLGEQASRMFRLLGIHPGSDITVSTAASLAGIPREQAYVALTELCDEHLLTEYGFGRYIFHGLLRTYAAERRRSCESEAERNAAVRRVLDYYLYTARVAAGYLCPDPNEIRYPRPLPGIALEEIGCPEQAADWFETERHALLALVSQAVDDEDMPHAWELPWVAAWYFRGRSLRDTLAAVQESALALAVRRGELAGQVLARQHLGWLRFLQGDAARAAVHLDAAAELAERLGDGGAAGAGRHDPGLPAVLARPPGGGDGPGQESAAAVPQRGKPAGRGRRPLRNRLALYPAARRPGRSGLYRASFDALLRVRCITKSLTAQAGEQGLLAWSAATIKMDTPLSRLSRNSSRQLLVFCFTLLHWRNNSRDGYR